MFSHTNIRPNEKVHTLTALYSIKLIASRFQKAKLRCVFNGKKDLYGIHYLYKSSHTPRAATVRLFLALDLAAYPRLEVGDVPQAFLQSPLQQFKNVQRILVCFPQDISPRDEHGNTIVYEVIGSIYGMKQAPYNFEQTLAKFLTKLNFTRSQADPTLWFKPGILVLVWVDDISIRATPECSEAFKTAMNREFGSCGFGPLTHCIGLTIIRNPKTNCIGFHQADFIQTLQKRFRITPNPKLTTPLPPGLYTSDKQLHGALLSPEDRKTYLQICGCLTYIATWSFPSIIYATSLLATDMQAPTKTHMQFARRVLAYVTARPYHGICTKLPKDISNFSVQDKLANGFAPTATLNHNKNILRIYTDANFGKERGYRSRGCVIITLNGAPIEFKSIPQSLVSLSTSESEVIAGSDGLKYILHLRHLMQEIGITQPSTSFLCDSQNAVTWWKNGTRTQRNLHFGVRHARVCEEHQNKTVTIRHCSTEHMVADMGTKQLSGPKHHHFESLLMTDMADVEL